VVITGIGVISPIGTGKEKFCEALRAGKSGVAKITRFDPASIPTKVAAEVNDFDPHEYMDIKSVGQTERATHFAVAAAKMAGKDANLPPDPQHPERIGVAIGTTVGGLDFALRQHTVFLKEGALKIHPFTATIYFAAACSNRVSMQLKAKGPSQTLSTACTSSSNAIGYGLNCIRQGTVDIMAVGGTEAPIFPMIFGAFCLSKIMTVKNGTHSKTPNPFDRTRDGIVVGEGAGVLILEELEHALKRNVHMYAEVLGYSATCDAYHIVKPDPSGKGAARSMRAALSDAGITPERVDYIHAHGSATIAGDRMETNIIKEVFGKHSILIPVSTIKAMIGHTQGAAGAIETIASILGMENNFIPPTINYEYPDPECNLDYVPNYARPARFNIVMNHSLALGGTNAVLIIKRFTG
jgi:3-oxoacyl-[acyl-carrier-protein] synthase II